MLTEAQATAVAAFLVAHTPGANGELEHSHISAWQLACEALAALGYATETPVSAGPSSSLFDRVCGRWG